MAKQNCPVGDDWVEMKLDGDKLVPVKKETPYFEEPFTVKDGVVTPKSRDLSGFSTRDKVFLNEAEISRVSKKVDKSFKSARKAGVITKSETDVINRKVNNLVKRGSIDSNEANAYRTMYLKKKIYENGHQGKGSGWIKSNNPSKTLWSDERVSRELSSALQKKRGQTKRIEVESKKLITDGYNRNQANRKFNKMKINANKASESTAIVNKLQESLKVAGVDINPGSLKDLTNKLYRVITKGDDKEVVKVAQEIGDVVRKYAGKADSGTPILDSINIGGRVLEGMEGVLDFNMINRSFNRFRGNQAEALLVKTRGGMKTAAEGIADRKRYSNLPNTKGKIKKVESGHAVDSNNRALVAGGKDVDFNPTVNRAQTKAINQSQARQYNIDTDVHFALKEIAETNPKMLVKGGYFKKVVDNKTGEVTYNKQPKFDELMSAADINTGRDFGYNWKVQFNGRLHPMASFVNPNGTPMNKALHLNTANAKIGKVVDEKVTTGNFKFEAAEFLGGPNTTSKRLALFDEYAPKMKAYGDAVLDRNKEAMRTLGGFLDDFSPKDAQMVMARSIEWSRMNKYKDAKGSLVGYEPKIRSGQDATASAIQIWGIGTRSRKLNKGSNIEPTFVNGEQVKQSAYSAIGPDVKASKVWQNNKVLRELTDKEATSIFKKPTLTTLYNIGTGLSSGRRGRNNWTGILGQLRKEFAELGDDVLEGITDGELKELTKVIAKSIDNHLPELGRGTKLIDKLFRYASKGGKAVEYTTPLTKQKVKFGVKGSRTELIETKIGGMQISEPIETFTDTISSNSTGFKAPAIVTHNMDADLVYHMKNQAAKDGIPLDTNHDSFWSSPVHYGKINKYYKEALKALYKADWIISMIKEQWKKGTLTRKEYNELLRDFKAIAPNDLPKNWEHLLDIAKWPSS